MKCRLLILVLSLVQFGFGQACTESVPIHALDQATGTIPELAPSALQASMGKTVLPILSIEHLRTRRLLILIDQSGSISEPSGDDIFEQKQKAMGVALQVLSQIPERLPHGLTIEYGLFNERSVFGDDFSSDSNYLKQSVITLRSQLSKKHNTTAIYDALNEALHRFGTTQPGDTILLFTDAGDNQSRHSAGQLERAFRAAHVRLFAVLVTTPDSPQQPEDITGPREVTGLAHNTGGRVETLNANIRAWTIKRYSEEQANELRRFWQQDVLNGYLLKVQTAVLGKKKKWRLKINKSADPKLKDVDLSYPERLLPCSAQVVNVSGR